MSTSIPPRGVLLQDWSTRVSSSGGDLKGSDQDGTSDDDPQSTTTMTQSFQEIPPPPLTSSSRRWDQFDTDNLEQESWRVSSSAIALAAKSYAEQSGYLQIP